MYKIKNILIHPDHPLVTDLTTSEEKRIGYHDHLVILMLCENAGKITTKEELLTRAWPGKHVSEGSLTQSISTIRNLIEDDGKTQKHLKTVAKIGYKLESDAVSLQGKVDDGLEMETIPLVDAPAPDTETLESIKIEEQCSKVANPKVTIPDQNHFKFNRNHIYMAIGCFFVVVAVIFPFYLTQREPDYSGWLHLAKMYSSENMTIYCKSEQEAQTVARSLAPLIKEKVAQGKLSRLILAHSDETLSIVILKPLAPPTNLVVMLDGPQSHESLVGMVKLELSSYVH
ncbi:winged helix-turn-helix domain-containing protein [Vibrio sp. AND4]|uniref:winged helix-turn-helix domain-containing protein n=1 Tax=Vibrio sp. AND4 TaxID=314289 RepID=UPI00015F14C3|nr:winged helix-turn-helix domain-containing protein [Vibrio sp. AND4]EDP58199.1 putative transcriptional regulator ToxR [Vibrio sp. AND4]